MTDAEQFEIIRQRSTQQIAELACLASYEISMSGKGAGLSYLRRLAALDTASHPIVERAKKALELADSHVMFKDDNHHRALEIPNFMEKDFPGVDFRKIYHRTDY
jgi:hypothetical protein